MADRLISNALGKYLSIFIKNWSKDHFNLSFLRGEGNLTTSYNYKCHNQTR
ncbi:hypothetical protein AKO1_002651 [Acrasis kona]|uniref:Uncharacterized protein n=1 Tax=Acrasis kona TaxID=1008807 RepID=A0AAW2Z090_9EUKA